jgi:probable F420-dependent oxidoreductase
LFSENAIPKDVEMKIDLMVGNSTWQATASLAREVEQAGFSGLVFTETSQVPWMSIASAAMATTKLEVATGIAVAFARSPMVTAMAAWELAENTKGRFRLGLGSQVRAHIERRYGMPFDPPGPRLKDYVLAVKACFEAFSNGGPIDYQGKFYNLTLLPKEWTPSNHPYGSCKIDIAAVNQWMCRMAAGIADGIDVHPLHSPQYLQHHLLPLVSEATQSVGRSRQDVELIIPVFVVPGDSDAERSELLERARLQIAFYGSTKNYAFQFEELGYDGISAMLNERLKAGDRIGMSKIISDGILANFAVVGKWSEIGDLLVERYQGIASRLVIYLAEESIRKDPSSLSRWSRVVRQVTHT